MSNPTGPKKEGGQIFAVLQRVGQSLMMPVSVLPAAGLLVALGRMMQNWSEGDGGAITIPLLHAIGKLFFSGGLAIFEQLPVVFAVGVAIGFTSGAGVAGLAAVVGYFTLFNVLKVMGDVRGLELAINTGVFGGILMGIISAKLYTRFHQTRLHPVLGFFSGKRLVPIVTAAAALLTGIVLGYVWPPIQAQIHSFGIYVTGSDLGPAFYAAGKRLLIPVGLHHVYYAPFLFDFGEFVTSAGKVLHGESARYFAGDATAGRFMASEFPLMLFGLPAATLAMYLAAPKNRRKLVAGVMLSAALTSIITGITEPIEFAFIFVAPPLYFFHVAAAFVSGLLTGYLDIHLGYTFSASAIDFVLGAFNSKNSIYLFTIVGPIIALLYFVVFYWAIRFFNFKTPGREDEEITESASAVAAGDKAAAVLAAIGGAANITNIDACITRLRLKVKDASLVKAPRLKELGAAGLLDAGNGNFQIIFGVESDRLKEEIKHLMEGGTVSAHSTPVAVASVKGGSSVILSSPMNGRVLAITEVPDATFADKILGDGFAIEPSEGVVFAPTDCEVVNVFRTQHALGLVTATGVEILIHVGLDTVKMEGRGFKALVKVGDKVKAGDRLLEFDLDKIRAEGKSTISPVVITNMQAVKNFSLLRQGSVTAKDNVLQIGL